MTDIHNDKILILDFGSQYTQLIARRIRELGVYCEIWAYDNSLESIKEFKSKGIILSGGPSTVTEEESPRAPDGLIELVVSSTPSRIGPCHRAVPFRPSRRGRNGTAR